MKFSKATVIRERTDRFPRRCLLKVNGRFYTAFGRLFAVRGNHIDCSEEEYKALCDGVTYSFTDWATLTGIYREE